MDPEEKFGNQGGLGEEMGTEPFKLQDHQQQLNPTSCLRNRNSDENNFRCQTLNATHNNLKNSTTMTKNPLKLKTQQLRLFTCI